MISFGLSEEQEMVRDAMRDFAEQAIRPIARDCDEASEIPADFLQGVWDLGLTSTQIPEIYGGGGEERACVTNAAGWWPCGRRCGDEGIGAWKPPNQRLPLPPRALMKYPG